MRGAAPDAYNRMELRHSDCFPEGVAATPQLLFLHRVFAAARVKHCFLDVESLGVDLRLRPGEKRVLEEVHRELFPVHYNAAFFQQVLRGQVSFAALKANLLLLVEAEPAGGEPRLHAVALNNVLVAFCVYRRELAKPFNLSLWKKVQFFFKNLFSAHVSTLGVLQECRRLHLAHFLLAFLQRHLLSPPRRAPPDRLLTFRAFFDECVAPSLEAGGAHPLAKQQLLRRERFVALKGAARLEELLGVRTFWDLEFAVFETELRALGLEKFLAFAAGDSKLAERVCAEGTRLELLKARVQKSLLALYLGKAARVTRAYQAFLGKPSSGAAQVSLVVLSRADLDKVVRYAPRKGAPEQRSSLEAFLLEQVLRGRALRDVDHLELELIVHNRSALRFYRKLGFALSASKKNFYVIDEVSFDCLKLKKDLR